MSNISLLELKRGTKVMNTVKVIKDTKNNSSKKSKENIITMMEKEWPEMTAEFRRLQREQYELFLHKQHDYGPGNISVGTMLQTPEEVKLSLTGLWFRMNDKMQRFQQIVINNQEPENESLMDTFMDIGNYAIIAQLVKEKVWGK